MLARHDGAAQVDGRDAVERLLGDLQRAGIAPGQADADMLCRIVDAAPALDGLIDRRSRVASFVTSA